MFINRLKQEEVREFIEKTFNKNVKLSINADNAENDSIGDSFFLEIPKVLKTQVIHFTDFKVECYDRKLDLEAINNSWKNFLTEKFGDEYKQAFNENLRKKYESEMIK